MKRKLTIAAGIIHRPAILFLDEPTTGIDVASARQIRKLIEDLNGSGKTIFLTTHYAEEAERLCGRITFIVSGKVIRVDSVSELMEPVQGKHVMIISISGGGTALEQHLPEAFPGLEFSRRSTGRVRVEAGEAIRVGPLVRFLEDRGIEVSEARKLRPSLEDVFVSITGIEADAMKKEREKKGGTRESLDSVLEHPYEGHAGLLSEAAQHQLGAYFPGRMDGDVFHQDRRRH